MKFSPETLLKGFLAKEDSRQMYVLIRKGRFRMRTIYHYIYHPKTPDRLEMSGHLRRAHRKRKSKGLSEKSKLLRSNTGRGSSIRGNVSSSEIIPF